MTDEHHHQPGLSPIERRLIERAADIMQDDPEQILFQHSMLCQTYFPYRDPGAEVQEWLQTNGQVTLYMQAGVAIQPASEQRAAQVIRCGLPFGAKSRLVLTHLNSRALKNGSPQIDLEEDTLTKFVRAMQDPLKSKAVAPNGREIRAYKDQIMRLNTVNLQLATVLPDGKARNSKPRIIDQFDFTLTLTKNERQRVLWPEYIRLSPEYFEHLQRHAVPLDERALAALAHNALSIDIYCWLAQRLHRIPEGKDLFLSRSLLWRQFGQGYKRMDKFAAVFKDALRQAASQYPRARLSLTTEGLTMWNSPPPIAGRLVAIGESGKSRSVVLQKPQS